MKKNILIVLFFLSSCIAYAQSDFDKFYQESQKAFEQFSRDSQADFEAFRQKANEDYANFMRQAWEAFDAHEAEIPIKEKTLPPVVYERPVIESQPTPQPIPEQNTKPQPLPNQDQKTQPAPLPIQEQQPTPQPAPQPIPEQKQTPQPVLQPIHEQNQNTQPAPEPAPQPIQVKPEVVVVPKPKPAPEPLAKIQPKEDVQYNNISVSYYGTPITIAFPVADNLKLARVEENAIADAWKVMSGKNYDITVKTALDARKSYSLCDWAYMDMLKEVTRKHYGQTNEAVLMQAFIMTQSGYRIRLGMSAEKLYMLVASDYTIYGMRYFTLDGSKFYLVNGDGKSKLKICSAKYDKEQALSLQMSALPKLNKERAPKRKLTSRKGVTVGISSNVNLINFFGNYPQACINGDFTTRWAAYANTPLEADIKNALYPTLRSVVENLSEDQAVDVLLNWVQTAFEYGYDDQIWGGDRAFFAQETLYYPYSDCEDRAILFSRIVRDIMKLDVVLLYYPGHLATAVAFNKSVSGDYLTYNNKRYIVCDPTYINAPIGRTMPGMNNQQAKIIALK